MHISCLLVKPEPQGRTLQIDLRGALGLFIPFLMVTTLSTPAFIVNLALLIDLLQWWLKRLACWGTVCGPESSTLRKEFWKIPSVL